MKSSIQNLSFSMHMYTYCLEYAVILLCCHSFVWVKLGVMLNIYLKIYIVCFFANPFREKLWLFSNAYFFSDERFFLNLAYVVYIFRLYHIDQSVLFACYSWVSFIMIPRKNFSKSRENELRFNFFFIAIVEIPKSWLLWW